jgi:hypothetical protein
LDASGLAVADVARCRMVTTATPPAPPRTWRRAGARVDRLEHAGHRDAEYGERERGDPQRRHAVSTREVEHQPARTRGVAAAAIRWLVAIPDVTCIALEVRPGADAQADRPPTRTLATRISK